MAEIIEVPRPKRSDVLHLPIEMIILDESYDIRYDYGDLIALRDSIIENGIKVPVTGYKNQGDAQYTLTGGNRRFKAAILAKELGYDLLVPFINEGKGLSEEDRVANMIIYNEGKPFTMLEFSESVARLSSLGMSLRQIAKKLAKSPTHISNCMILSKASPELKQEIIDGVIAPTTVIEMLRKENSEEVHAKVEEAKYADTQTSSIPEDHGDPKQITGTKMGLVPSKFSIAKIRSMYIDLENEEDEYPNSIDKSKLEALHLVMQFVEGSITEHKFTDGFRVEPILS